MVYAEAMSHSLANAADTHLKRGGNAWRFAHAGRAQGSRREHSPSVGCMMLEGSGLGGLVYASAGMVPLK